QAGPKLNGYRAGTPMTASSDHLAHRSRRLMIRTASQTQSAANATTTTVHVGPLMRDLLNLRWTAFAADIGILSGPGRLREGEPALSEHPATAADTGHFAAGERPETGTLGSGYPFAWRAGNLRSRMSRTTSASAPSKRMEAPSPWAERFFRLVPAFDSLR